jgi:hypothetical protein
MYASNPYLDASISQQRDDELAHLLAFLLVEQEAVVEQEDPEHQEDVDSELSVLWT